MGFPRQPAAQALCTAVLAASTFHADAQAQNTKEELRAMQIQQLLQQRAIRADAEGQNYEAPRDHSAATGPLKRLEDRLLNPSLTAEDRARLLREGMDVFRRAPRAARGVEFGGTTPDGAVIIERPIEGFPSVAYLGNGDIILEIDGAKVSGYDHVRAEILSRLPNESIPMLVQRRGPNDAADDAGPGRDAGRDAGGVPGRVIEIIDVPLGGYERLQQVGPADRLLRAAWQARVDRLLAAEGIGGGPEIGAELTARDWLVNEDLWRIEDAPVAIDEDDERSESLRNVSPLRYLRLGGRPRDAGDTPALRRLDGFMARNASGLNETETAGQTPDDQLRDAIGMYRIIAEEVRSKQAEVARVEAGHAEGGDIEERLSVLRENISEMTSELEQLRGAIAQMELERARAEAARTKQASVREAQAVGEAAEPPKKTSDQAQSPGQSPDQNPDQNKIHRD